MNQARIVPHSFRYEGLTRTLESVLRRDQRVDHQPGDEFVSVEGVNMRGNYDALMHELEGHKVSGRPAPGSVMAAPGSPLCR